MQRIGWSAIVLGLAIATLPASGPAVAGDGAIGLRPSDLGGAAPSVRQPGYVVDRNAGSVRFGDGVYGARPPAGNGTQNAYRQGSGNSGNNSAPFQRTPCISLFGRC